VLQQKEVYLKRQAIVEHPFGTIKRGWSYTHTLVKGLHKVNGEMNLIALVYNLKRTINIMGINTMLHAIKTWIPNYSTVLCNLKEAFMQLIFSSKVLLHYLHLQVLPLKTAA